MEFKNYDLQSNFHKDTKKIIICNHSTPFIDVLWIHNSLKLLETKHFIYMSYFFNYENEWLRPIRSPKFIKNEVNYLNSLKEYCAIIFPSGGTINWKSGFYYLSKLTRTPIYLVHLNYIDNKIEVIDRIFIFHQSLDEIRNKCISIYKSFNKVPIWTNILKYVGYGDECMIH